MLNAFVLSNVIPVKVVLYNPALTRDQAEFEPILLKSSVTEGEPVPSAWENKN